MILISFIIPIFNTQKYLEDLITSLNREHYKSIEFIFINDNSTDNSLEQLKELLKSFKNTYYILSSSKNKGLSYTRNKGLELAQGEYVFFLDSDDWLSVNAIDIMKNLITLQPNVDIFIFRDVKKKVYSNEKIEYLNKNYTVESNINLLNYRHMSSCIKLYKKKLFSNLNFKKGRLYEDVYLLVDLFNRRNLKIINTDLPLYNYRINESSITKSKFTEYKFNEYEKLFNYCKNNLDKVYYEFLYLRLKNHLLEQAKTSNLSLYKEKILKYENEENIDTLNLLFLMWNDGENPALKKTILNKIYEDAQLYKFLDYKYKNIAKQKKWIEEKDYWLNKKDEQIKEYKKWIEAKDYWLNKKDEQIKEYTDDRIIRLYLKIKKIKKDNDES